MTVRMVTQSALARELNVSRQAISKLVKAGKIQQSEDGRIDFEQARLSLANTVHPGSKTAESLGLFPTSEVGATAGGDVARLAPADSDGEAPTSFHVARTLDMLERARITRIERRKLDLEVMEVESVRAVVANLLAATRDSFMQIPARLSQVLAAETDAGKVQAALQAEITTCLGGLASMDQRLLQRAKEDLG